MNPNPTVEDLKNYLTAKMEDQTLPNILEAWAKTNQGKRLTVKNIPQGFRVSKYMRRTELVDNTNRDFHSQRRFTVSPDETNVTIPTPDELRRLNPADYAGAEKRNANRQKALADDEKLADLCEKIKTAIITREAYINTLMEIKSVCTGFECLKDYADRAVVDFDSHDRPISAEDTAKFYR